MREKSGWKAWRTEMSQIEGLRVSGLLLQELPLGRKSFSN
jgi:hypothetical protein